jgi:hypothetical protein
MKANPRFLRQPRSFWANVRTISQAAGYTDKTTQQIKVPTISQITNALDRIGLDSTHLVRKTGRPTKVGQLMLEYFQHRATVLNDFARPRLMSLERARAVYEQLRRELEPMRPFPMNKQKGEKKAPAYFTAIINALIEANAPGLPWDSDPRILTTITHNRLPVRTMSRRIDGAFPGPVNPVAIWEIKEYYYTTTFGSRVADAVYETLLDGMELEELREHEGIDIKHYLMLDDYRTWWEMGKSYLCRITDMLHMGYVDEALFGYEVVETLPRLVNEWGSLVRRRSQSTLRNHPG